MGEIALSSIESCGSSSRFLEKRPKTLFTILCRYDIIFPAQGM
jgi:hypothetical protein